MTTLCYHDNDNITHFCLCKCFSKSALHFSFPIQIETTIIKHYILHININLNLILAKKLALLDIKEDEEGDIPEGEREVPQGEQEEDNSCDCVF